MSATLKIMSLNVREISNFKKRRTIFTWCRRKSADVIFSQETHSNKTTEIQWKNEWGDNFKNISGLKVNSSKTEGMWNNQEIRINNKPVFYKRYFNNGIRTVGDLRFDLNNIDSYELQAKYIEKTNFQEWTGLRHSIPLNLRNANYKPDPIVLNPSFKTDSGLFDVTKKKSKDYYSLFVRKKARFPNHAQKLKGEFNLSDEALKKAFCLPHSVAFEPYVQAFQFKVLNSILYTNSKLHKIGYISDNLCSFCKRESETIQHLFYNCSYSITFWKDFELYYLSLTKQQIHLELRDILIGVLTPECPLLNYLLLIGKIYLWGCRRNNELPNIGGYKFKVSLKYDTEKFICTKNNTLDIFKKKWTILRPI